jgi:hypothetical protein
LMITYLSPEASQVIQSVPKVEESTKVTTLPIVASLVAGCPCF